MSDADQVNFGHEVVSREEKTERVGQVFHKVAGRYDMMNDLMSFGAHRLFKRMVIIPPNKIHVIAVTHMSRPTSSYSRIKACRPPITACTSFVALRRRDLVSIAALSLFKGIPK